jgi:hypothetical protein
MSDFDNSFKNFNERFNQIFKKFDVDGLFNNLTTNTLWYSSKATYIGTGADDPLKGVPSDQIEITTIVKDGYKVTTKKHTKADGTEVIITKKSKLTPVTEKTETIEELKLQLEKALEKEDYEQCIIIKNKINKLKK